MIGRICYKSLENFPLPLPAILPRDEGLYCAPPPFKSPLSPCILYVLLCPPLRCSGYGYRHKKFSAVGSAVAYGPQRIFFGGG